MPSVLEILQLIEQLRDDNFYFSVVFSLAVMTLVVSFPLPFGSLFSVTMGYLYGVLLGSVIIVASILLSTAVLISISVFNNDKFPEKYKSKFIALSKYFDTPFRLILLRQVSLLPNFLYCMAANFFNVPKSRVLAATFIGVWPNILLATYLGQSLGSLVEINDPSGRPSALFGVGVSIAALLVLMLVSRKMKTQISA